MDETDCISKWNPTLPLHCLDNFRSASRVCFIKGEDTRERGKLNSIEHVANGAVARVQQCSVKPYARYIPVERNKRGRLNSRFQFP